MLTEFERFRPFSPHFDLRGLWDLRDRTTRMDVAIIGGGICGLSLALNLHKRGIACRVYERAPEIKPLGVGITLLPHAMREFTALGVADLLLKAGIENRESRFFNRF